MDSERNFRTSGLLWNTKQLMFNLKRKEESGKNIYKKLETDHNRNI
jgi:hypothetical protein